MVRVGMSISVCSIYKYTVGILYVVGSSRKSTFGVGGGKSCVLELTRVYETYHQVKTSRDRKRQRSIKGVRHWNVYGVGVRDGCVTMRVMSWCPRSCLDLAESGQCHSTHSRRLTATLIPERRRTRNS